MPSEQELRQKRTLVGILAIGCTAASTVLLMVSWSDALAAALLRVGLLLGAFWLALPTQERPSAWARVSPWSIGAIAIAALLLPRLKFFLPVLLTGIALGWVVRPRPKRK